MTRSHKHILRNDSSRARRSRGAVAIYVAIAGFLLLALMGLALDTAHVQSAAQDLQDVADAAAIAAAESLGNDSQANLYMNARQAAVDVALLNEAANQPVQLNPNTANAAGGDVVVGRWDSLNLIFTPDTFSPNSVQVTARRTSGSSNGPLGLVFGGAFGVGSSEVARTSVALVTTNMADLIYALSDTAAGAFTMTGNATLDATAGNIHVDSSDACGVDLGGTVTVLTQQCEVVGQSCIAPNVGMSGQMVDNADPEPDPLASLPEPSWNVSLDLGAITGGGSYGPGYYSGGIDLTSGAVVLQPGTYVLDGPGCKVAGTSTLQGYEVTLYVLQSGEFFFGGDADIQLTPPIGGPYDGVTLFQDRLNANVFHITGHCTFDLTGTAYIPSGRIWFTIDPHGKIGQIIADTIDMRGTSEIVVTGVDIATTNQNPSVVFLVQ